MSASCVASSAAQLYPRTRRVSRRQRRRRSPQSHSSVPPVRNAAGLSMGGQSSPRKDAQRFARCPATAQNRSQERLRAKLMSVETPTYFMGVDLPMSPALALAQPTTAPDAPPVRAPYDVLAPVYDLLTGDYAYGEWVAGLLDLARAHGLHGCRTLDVACGNGNATLPLLNLGHDVTGCDISPAMVEAARRRTRGRARLLEADVLAMPLLGRFDLATC